MSSPAPRDKDEDSEGKVKIARRGLGKRKKYCPQCFSEVKLGSSLSGWLVPEFYVCEKCGYSGYVALEKEDDKPG